MGLVGEFIRRQETASAKGNVAFSPDEETWDRVAFYGARLDIPESVGRDNPRENIETLNIDFDSDGAAAASVEGGAP